MPLLAILERLLKLYRGLTWSELWSPKPPGRSDSRVSWRSWTLWAAFILLFLLTLKTVVSTSYKSTGGSHPRKQPSDSSTQESAVSETSSHKQQKKQTIIRVNNEWRAHYSWERKWSSEEERKSNALLLLLLLKQVLLHKYYYYYCYYWCYYFCY